MKSQAVCPSCFRQYEYGSKVCEACTQEGFTLLVKVEDFIENTPPVKLERLLQFANQAANKNLVFPDGSTPVQRIQALITLQKEHAKALEVAAASQEDDHWAAKSAATLRQWMSDNP